MDGSNGVNPSLEARETLAASLLGKLADEIDISSAQYLRAQKAYETVSTALAASTHPTLVHAAVFPQGSFAIGTTVKPIDREDGEFDVDLACRLDKSVNTLRPDEAKKILGDCLKADDRYESKLEEKTRCWRINYSGDFHLDVCPLAKASLELDAIPDRALMKWIPTSPEQYAVWFKQLADSVQAWREADRIALEAHVDPFPEANPNKGWLRRVVQLLKRHRDQWRMKAGEDIKEFAPISVILTTLAARVVERQPEFFKQQALRPYQIIKRILEDLPKGITTETINGREELWVKSPVADENFANRWNEDDGWRQAFEAWLIDAHASVHQLVESHGLDSGKQVLAESFGSHVAGKVFAEYGAVMRAARDAGQLKIERGGLSLAAAGTAVKQHTFFGG